MKITITEKDVNFEEGEYTMDAVFQAVASLLLTTMTDAYEMFRTYEPLIDKLDQVISDTKKQLDPVLGAKEFAREFQKEFLMSEVTMYKNGAYKPLFKKMEKMSRKAVDKIPGVLNAKSDKQSV